MEQCPEFLDAIIVYVEEDSGEKVVHIMADSYDSGSDEVTPYRFVEYTFFYVPLAHVIVHGLFDKRYDGSEVKQYIEDCDFETIDAHYKAYDNGETPTVIQGSELTMDLPLGCYIVMPAAKNGGVK